MAKLSLAPKDRTSKKIDIVQDNVNYVIEKLKEIIKEWNDIPNIP